MFEIFQSPKTQKFRFRLKAGNGEIVLSSQAYADRRGCEKGIESVRKHAADESNFEIREAAGGTRYFVLKAANGQVIGQSQQYRSRSGPATGIASVARNVSGPVREAEA
jgi:uncharacterized protein YegP (UPF0339 family)